MFDKSRRMLSLIEMKTGVDVSECLNELNEAEANFKELICISDKWTDPNTQKQLYLGRCVKAAYAKGYDVNASLVYTSDRFKTLDELIEWGKRQGVE